jgi:MFS family permease
VLSAFESRNYRLFFAGQIVSLVGTWMSQTASLWLIYQLSSSPAQLGLLGFVSQAPIFFLAPVAGVMADRVNRHRLLLITQVAAMIQALALAALTLSGKIDAASLLALSLVKGVINGIDMPTRQALVVSFVQRQEHLSNAIALNSSMFNLARLVGPAIGGFVVAFYGAGVCFLIDGLSYIAVIASLLVMRLQLPPKRTNLGRPLAEMRDGFVSAFSFRPMRVLLTTLAIISAAGFSYTVLTPIYARDVFDGDARVLGWLMSASAVGALTGAIYLGTRTSIHGLGSVVALGGALMGSGLIGFAFSRFLPLSLACLAVTGLGGVLTMASSNTLVQSLVSNERRGRIMAIFTMSFTGAMPIGHLVFGGLTKHLGAASSLCIGGLICLATAALFYRSLPALRAAAAPILARNTPVEPAG